MEVQVRDHGRPAREGLRELLLRLATLSCAPHRAVSLYLDTRWRDEQQRDRVRLEVRDRARALLSRFPDDAALAADLERAVAFTQDRVVQFADVGYHGVALFLCTPAGLDLSLRCRAELPTVLAAGPLPLVRPLAALAHRAARVLVAIVDSNTARLYEVALGDVDTAVELSGAVPKRHASGGWAQLRLQHHRQGRIDALHRDAAHELARLFDDTLPARVLVGGRAQAVANFKRLLPERVAQRLSDLGELDGREGERELVELVEERIAAISAQEERELAGAVRTLALSGGRGAIGLPGVIDALNRGRVMRVLCAERLDRPLEVCETCGVIALGTDDAGGCLSCGGTTHALEASEAIVRAALPLGAEIDLVDEPWLEAEGGVVASLRF